MSTRMLYYVRRQNHCILWCGELRLKGTRLANATRKEHCIRRAMTSVDSEARQQIRYVSQKSRGCMPRDTLAAEHSHTSLLDTDTMQHT
jgi:hypothetical protein